MTRGSSRFRSRSPIQGSFVGLSLAVEIDYATGLTPPPGARRLRADAGDRHLVDAFRRLARRELSERDRLSRPAHAGFFPDLRDRGRDRRLRRARAAAAQAADRVRRRRDGPRHLGHALRRHARGPPRRADLPGGAVRRRLRPRVAIAASAFALAGARQPAEPPAAVPRARSVLGLAISGMHYTAMAGHAARPALLRRLPLRWRGIGSVAQHARAARDRHRVRRVRRLPVVARAGRRRAIAASCARRPKRSRLRRGRPFRFRRPTSKCPRQPPRSLARAPDAALAGVRVEKDGRARLHPRRATSTPFAPTRITPSSTTGAQEYFCNQSISALEARLDSASSCASTAATSCGSTRVSRLKRVGEAAVVELGDPVRCSIPVARGQYRELKTRIEARSADPRSGSSCNCVSQPDAFRAEIRQFVRLTRRRFSAD